MESTCSLLVNYSFKSICLLEEGDALIIFVKCLEQHQKEIRFAEYLFRARRLEANELPQNRKVNLYRTSLTLCINWVSRLVTNEALCILICTKINTTIQINTQTVQNNLPLPHVSILGCTEYHVLTCLSSVVSQLFRRWKKERALAS